MCAGPFGGVGAAFVGCMTDAEAAADERHIGCRQHYTRGLRSAVGAVGWLCAAAHPFDGFERTAIAALIFIDWHGISLDEERTGPDKRPVTRSKIGGEWHVDAAVQEFGWPVRVGHHVPFKDLIGYPKRGAGIWNIHDA